jgi:hypothetical protein
VSCFFLSQDASGVRLEGTAYSFVRERDDGELVAPVLARWALQEVVSYDAATHTLVYSYEGKMECTDRPFAGRSAIHLDFSVEKATKGWYGISDDPIRFRLVPLDDLEACLGVLRPASERQRRYERVATVTPEQLKACVPPLD